MCKSGILTADSEHFLLQKCGPNLNLKCVFLYVAVVIQSDDTDGTTANEDEVLHQQPNNTRGTASGSLGPGSKKNSRELTLSSKARYSM